MGLNEKRHIHAYDTDYTPSFVKRLEEITGAQVDVKVDWESFKTLEDIQYLDTAGFTKVKEALEELCGDTFSKQAVAEGLKRIRFTCVGSPGDKRCNFADGALDIAATYHNADGNVAWSEIRDALSSGL